jgi:hypothetical protein
MFEKLKSLLAEDSLFYSLLVVLVAVVSFGLGRQSVQFQDDRVTSSGQNSEVSVLEAKPVFPTVSTSSARAAVGAVTSGEVVVVASKSGTKYHLPTCPGAKQIKPENIVEFSSIQEAEAAGYTPASNCKGLSTP